MSSTSDFVDHPQARQHPDGLVLRTSGDVLFLAFLFGPFWDYYVFSFLELLKQMGQESRSLGFGDASLCFAFQVSFFYFQPYYL